MKKALFSLLLFPLLLLSCSRETVDLHEMAVKIADKGLEVCELGNYRGVGLVEGMAELALATGRQDDMDRVMILMNRYKNKEVEMFPRRNFLFFDGGGLGACMLANAGIEEVKPQVQEALQRQWDEQPRTTDGFIQGNINNKNNRIFIDCIGSDCASYMYGGQALGIKEWQDYGAEKGLEMLKLFYVPETGLFHQGRGCFSNDEYCALHPDELDSAYWSRGNGWAAKGMRCFVSDLDHSHPLYGELAEFSRNYFEGVMKYADENGMFHQEMDDPESYVEVSGTLYIYMGMAACIKEGILPAGTYKPIFEKGLRGIFDYVDPDGSIGHVCEGCLCPNMGTKDDYANGRKYFFNEDHACGPMVQFLASAISLGYDSITLDRKMGCRNEGDRMTAEEWKRMQQ